MPDSPTPRTPLSRERVLRAAVGIADAEGIKAVTMRSVAASLDCEAMTLYYYVADKKALLEGMVEAVVGEIVETALGRASAPKGADWRDTVAWRCLAARRVMLAHPWAPPVVGTQASTPPNVYALFEALVGTMVEAGCSYELAHRAIHSLGSLLLGFTQELFEPTADDSGTSVQEMEAMALAMPHLSRLAEVAVHATDDALSVCDTQAEFEFTLRLILDGLESQRLREV